MADAADVTFDAERVIATMPEPVAVVDGRRFVTANQPYVELYGFPRPDSLAGEPWASRFAEAERGRVEREILPACREDDRWRGTVVGRRRDGATFSHELSVATLDDEHFVCTCREPETGRRPERDDRDHRPFTEQVVDTADDIVYVLDEDGHAVLWNEKLRETTGYADREIEALDGNELVGPVREEDVPSRDRHTGQLADRQIDSAIVTKGGERVPHAFRETRFEDPETGHVYRCVVARDVRERLEREREITRYETIVETVEDGIYVLDATFRLSFVNDAFCEMTELSRGELIGMPAMELFDYEDEVAAAEEIRERVIEGDTSIGTVQGTLPTAEGERVLEARFRLNPAPDGEFRGSIGVVRDVTERERRERELRDARRFNEELVEHAPFGMFRLSEDLRITYENPRAEEIIGLPDDEEASAVIGVDVRELPSIEGTVQADRFTRLRDGETVEFEFPFESIYGREAYLTGRGVPLYRDGTFDGAVLMVNDISERRRHERDLERQRDELETLDRINELLFEIARDLFESPTRAEIEQTVCERLASSDLYRFAWIGEPGSDGDLIVPRASAGIDDGYIDTITVTASEAETSQGPGGRALRSGTVHVSQDVRSDPTFEPWREEALDRGVKSVAAIPIVYGETTYGILAVYAARPLGFSPREQAGFETLGKAAGFAINAIENRRLLFADSIVELEFDVADSGLVFVRASDQLGCELTITGYVESDSGSWSVYLTVDGAAPTAVRDFATDDPAVEHVRVIADGDDGGLVEFVMADSAVNGITEHGAILTAGTIEAGRGRFCIEVPQSTDVRRLAARFRATFPESTLVAQREFDRPAQTAGEIRRSIDDRLTDRQQEALVRAHHAGYFDWPRKSTAGDVADSMGIAETTFHYHLRNALETLSSAFVSLEPR